MKPILFILALFIFVLSSFGQTQATQKIKIVLLGVPHFTPSPTDVYKNEGFNPESKKGQKEIAEVVNKLVAFKPNQICVERELDYQPKLDSLYEEYLKGNYKLQVSEIDQLGFQTAKKLALPKLTTVNYMGYFEMKPIDDFAEKNNQSQIISNLHQFAKTNTAEITHNQQNLSLKDFLIYDNSPYALNNNQAYYSRYIVKIGKDDSYVGTNLVAEWYKTNLHIYTNILRKVQPTDKALLIIYGQGHIPILKHLFESNSDFEVVEVKEVLK